MLLTTAAVAPSYWLGLGIFIRLSCRPVFVSQQQTYVSSRKPKHKPTGSAFVTCFSRFMRGDHTVRGRSNVEIMLPTGR